MHLLRIDKKHDKFSDYNIALFTIIFMNIQLIPIEGFKISTLKVIFMAMCPFITFYRCREFSKATMWGFVFWGVTVALSVLQFGTPRMSTFYYTALFLFAFNMYYNFVYQKHVFTLNEFIDILKFLIFAYCACLLLQQASMLAGMRSNAFANMVDVGYYELFRLNSLAIEPSHAARLLTVLMFALLKCTEYKLGYPPSPRYLWATYRWVICAFLYTMIGIGSGTAFVGLAILSLYFMKPKYAFLVVVAGFALYTIIPLIDYEPLNRAMAVFEATKTGDTDEVIQADRSAASRVNIIVDTFKYTDFSDSQMWFGRGIGAYYPYAVNSHIVDYGLISYFLKVGMFLSCCFTGFISLEMLMFILLFSTNIGNIAYGWGALMVFTTVKYFMINRKFYQEG